MKALKALLYICLVLVLQPAVAQEGYPLEGTWRGYWGGDETSGTLAVIVMSWDGQEISGRINPGRSTIHFDHAALDASNWHVRIEATALDGEPIVIEGVLGNIGAYNRTITGTWSLAGNQHPIVLTRE